MVTLRHALTRTVAALCALVLVNSAGVGGAAAREEIVSYAAEIVVRADGGLDITETIAARVEGEQIQRGLFRDLADSAPAGMPSRVTIHAVERDGAPAPYALIEENGFERIRVGEQEVLLEHGIHTFMFRYSLAEAVAVSDGRLTFEWDVTGTWPFRILAADVVVRLPGRSVGTRFAATVGPHGQPRQWTGKARVPGNGIAFYPQGTIQPGETVTVQISALLRP